MSSLRPGFLSSPPVLAHSSSFLQNARCMNRSMRCRVRRASFLLAKADAEIPTASEVGIETTVESGDGVDLGGDMSATLGQVGEIIELVSQFSVGDMRLEHEGTAVEISMPGGRGFVDGKLRDPPVSEAAPAGGPAEMSSPTEVGDGGTEGRGQEEGVAVEGEAVDAQQTAPEQKAEGDVQGIRKEDEEDGKAIRPSDFVVTSNRVGVFYSGAKNKPPLVNVDDHVEFNKPVCIIEQLGQQYVYKSEVSGTVVSIFVEDGDPVEYDQKIMVIRPD